MGNNHVIPVIVKWEGGKLGNAILFFPDYPVNIGMIGCYVHLGQHSEAHTNYYWGLKNPKGDKQEREAAELLSEYARCVLEPGEALKRVYKDTAVYRRRRWEQLV